MPGHHVVLLVHDHDDIGLVGDHLRSPQAIDAEPTSGREALTVRCRDRDNGQVGGEGQVLEALDDPSQSLLLVHG